MIRGRDGDAYGSVILTPQVGTARMAMVIRDSDMDDGVGIVQISPPRSGEEEDSEEERERQRKEAEEKLNQRYSRLHPPPPLETPIPDRRDLHALHAENLAMSGLLGKSIEAVEPNCGTRGVSTSLVWKNNRFRSWVVCRGVDGGDIGLRWWDVVNNRGIDEENCTKVNLEGVGVAGGEIEGHESC